MSVYVICWVSGIPSHFDSGHSPIVNGLEVKRLSSTLRALVLVINNPFAKLLWIEKSHPGLDPLTFGLLLNKLTIRNCEFWKLRNQSDQILRMGRVKPGSTSSPDKVSGSSTSSGACPAR